MSGDVSLLVEVGMFLVAGIGVVCTAIANLIAGVWLVSRMNARQHELRNAIEDLRVAIKELALEYRADLKSMNSRVARAEELGARLEERTAITPAPK